MQQRGTSAAIRRIAAAALPRPGSLQPSPLVDGRSLSKAKPRKPASSRSASVNSGALSTSAADASWATANELLRESELSFARNAAGVAENYPAKHMHVIGVDEAGVGAIAGPIVASAVYIPHDVCVPGLFDSKQLSDEDRREVFDLLMMHKSVLVHVAIEHADTINQIGHLTVAHMNALATAFARIDGEVTTSIAKRSGADVRSTVLRRFVKSNALGDAAVVSQLQAYHPVVAVIVDGSTMPPSMTRNDSHFASCAVAKADTTCPAVAAASIVSKVFRDNLMLGYHREMPHFNFAVNKGYCTDEHVRALTQHGFSALHRTVGEASAFVRPPACGSYMVCEAAGF